MRENNKRGRENRSNIYKIGGTKKKNWRNIIEKKFKDRKQEYGLEIKNLNLKNERSHYVLGNHYPEYSKQRCIKLKSMGWNSKERAIYWYKQTFQVDDKRKSSFVETLHAKWP